MTSFLLIIPTYFFNQEIVPPLGKGDHDSIILHSTLTPLRKKPIRRRIQLWKHIDHEALKRDARSFCSLFLQKHDTKNEFNMIWNCLKENLFTIMEDNVPSKMTSSKIHQPWITTNSKRLLRKKEKYYKKAKTHNTPRLWSKYKTVKRLCQKECRRAHSNYVNEMLANDTKNKKLWTYVKSKNQDNTGIPDLKNDQERLIQDPQEKANLLNQQFSSVFSNPEPKINKKLPEDTKLPPMINITVTTHGVLKLLDNTSMVPVQ